LVVEETFLNNVGGWRFLEQTFDSQGTKLATKVVSDFGVTETVAIEMPRVYLVAHSRSRLDIKIIGSRGDLLIKSHGSYVQGFLSALK
jgi:hypothetical protein